MGRNGRAEAGRERNALRRALRNWYDRARRDLPWRETPPNPYQIWIAEIMLQQTRVSVVLPYWRRFIVKFPTVQHLAAASVDDVLRHWAGLGYYRRAHHLHDAARRVIREHDGILPADPIVLRTLPGIGRYTAGAIASIGFGRQAAVLDGNVARVLSRLFHPVVDQPGDPRAATEALWGLADWLVPRRRPGEFNQALMELGALVCLPARPRCADCPLARRCAARQAGVERQVPPKARAVDKPLLEVVAVVAARRSRILMAKRPIDGLWPGMWDLPGGELAAADNAEEAAVQTVRRVGLSVERLTRLDVVTCQLTHRTYRANVFAALGICGRTREAGRHAWMNPDEALTACSRAAARIIQVAVTHGVLSV